MASLIRQVISLESGQGYLPLWMAFVSGIAVFNAVQNYITTTLTKKVYSKTDQGMRVHGIVSKILALTNCSHRFELKDIRHMDIDKCAH